MSVTAKFKVSGIRNYNWENQPDAGEVILTPDYAQGRNKEWAEATPSGSISLHIQKAEAFKQFEQGKAFTVTFEPED